MIHITDFNGDIIDFISKSDGAVTEAEHMINVEDKLETFDFTVLTSRTEHMQKRNRVIIEDKDGQYREFIIYNISSDLNGYTRVQTNASALEDIKTAKPVPPHKLDKHTVKQALEYALADTGWKVSDEAEWGGTRTTSWTGWHDRISILKQLETTYDMRLSFHVEVGSNRIEKRLVSLNKVEPMFNGEEIVYGDNMINLKRTVDFSDIATALICLGPEDSETGKREIVEVKDDDAQAQFGLPYRYIWDIYEPQSNDEDMTKERLTTLGRTALNKRKQESVSYEIDGIGLSASAGDMIRVKNEDFTPELYVDAEVVEVTTDLISGESTYKFGVIKEYTRDDVYARFNAMLGNLRERLNKVVENTDSIISERLEEELKYVERYIEKSPTPPLNPKEGQLWLDTSHDGVAVLKRYENGEWIKSSVDDVKDIGGMTREETMYEALKERFVRNEVDYSEVFKRHGALVSEKHYHYVDEDTKNDLTNRYNALQQSYDDFKIAFNNINAEQPTIGLITTAISRAIEFEARLKEYNDSYYVARKSFDEVIALLQSQYSDEKYDELLNEIADSVGGIVQEDGSIDMSEANQKRLDEAMELVAGAIGGTWNGNQLIADVPNREELDSLNQSLKQYFDGELDSLDGKLGKQIETVVKQAKDEFSVAIDSVEKKVDGIEVGGRNLIAKKDIDINTGEFDLSKYDDKGTITIDTKDGVYSGLRIQANKLEKNTDYIIRYKYQKLSGTLESFGGHVDATFKNGENSTYIDGERTVSHSAPDSVFVGDDEKEHVVIYKFRTTGVINENDYFYIQPNRRSTTPVTVKISEWKLEKGTIPTDWSPAPEDYDNAINNLTQEVTKNTTSLSVLENEISLKADSDKVKQILDDELEPIKSNVQSNKAELKVQSDLIASKVDSATYEVDKDGIVKDIETNASAIEQTSNSLTSNINSVNKRIDEQDSIIDTNKSSITQLNNQIALKVDSEYVKQILDDELKVVKSNVSTNQSQLKILSNQISSKVEKSEYTTDINGITQDISNTKSEVKQLSDSVNSKITSVEQKFDDMKIGGRNLVRNSDFSNSFEHWYANGNYELITIDNKTALQMKTGNNLGIYQYPTETEVGAIYTFSFEAKAVNKTSELRIGFLGQPTGKMTTVDISDDWKRYTYTTTRGYEQVQAHIMHIYAGINNFNDGLYITNIKLEKGTIATDWTPAPEDYQTQIDNQDKILTKHETEIEQNKLGLNTKVSYTEMNGTNKTLEKLLTEFSQTADGFNFRIDSNGMIQDLTFDKNAFKLNSNLIEFNDGDVVIKDGRTTIKDAYIHKLVSDDAFIQNAEITKLVSKDKANVLTVDNGLLSLSRADMQGYKLDFSSNGINMLNQNGDVRMRLDNYMVTSSALGTSNSNVYLATDTGFEARVVDRNQLPGSGAINDYTYRPMRALIYRFPDVPTAYFTLYNGGEFRFTGESTSNPVYQDVRANVFHGAGFRTTTTNLYLGTDNLVHVVNKGFVDGSTGSPIYRDLRANDIYNRALITTTEHAYIGADGELRVANKGLSGIYRDVRARGYYGTFLETTATNMHVRASGEVRFTRNGTTGTYIPIRFSEWTATSHEKYKHDIDEWDYNVLDIFKNDLKLHRYKFNSDLNTEYDRYRHGIIIRYDSNKETFPVEWRNGDGFDGNEVMWWNTKAIQELAHENDELKDRINDLENKLNKIMEMIA